MNSRWCYRIRGFCIWGIFKEAEAEWMASERMNRNLAGKLIMEQSEGKFGSIKIILIFNNFGTNWNWIAKKLSIKLKDWELELFNLEDEFEIVMNQWIILSCKTFFFLFFGFPKFFLLRK